MQLRFKTGLTSEEYVKQQSWRYATLEHCPLHPNGDCSLARHGTYGRVEPLGTRVARWYCPEGRRTFSLLPDCLASRLSGSLCEIEAVVIQVEQSKSLEAAVEYLRPDIELPGVIRWTRRRVKGVHASLGLLRTLYPERFAGCQPTITSFGQHIGGKDVLLALRDIAALHLAFLAPPLGFKSPFSPSGEHKMRHQQQTGPDPPSILH